LPLPNLETQNKIVAILDKAKAILNKREETIQKYDELKWSTFYNNFDGWQYFDEKLVEEIASNEHYSLSSGPFGSNLTSKDYVDNPGVLILRGKNITSGKLDLSDIKYVSEEKAIELKRSEIKPDDIVIVAVGSSGKALKIPNSLPRAIISQNFNKVTCNQEIINPTYFEYCFNSNIVQHQLKSIITDAGRTFLSLTNIKGIKIPLPPIQLQNEFVHIIEKIEISFSRLETSKTKIDILLNSISQLAFKGEHNYC
jgi:type I restriction enzyme S subunit